MQQLATIIQEQLDTLVDQYDARLRSVPGYSSLPEAVWRDQERRFLNLIIQSLEAADYSPLVQYAQERATQWAARGLNLAWFQQALSVPEEILVPLVQSVETGNFVWQALNRSQSVVWQMMAERTHQAEMALAQERNLLHTLIDSLPDQIFFKDTEGRVILNNLADARAMRVASPAEAIGKSVFDVFPVDLAELYHADDMTVVHSGQAINNRVEPGIDEAGQVRWIQTTKVPLTDEQGKPIGLVGFSHDITQLKISELRVQELLKMREHQARTSTEVSQEIAAAPELRELFQRVVTLIKERFNYYHAQIFRYDPTLDAIVLVVGYGEVGQHMLADGHQLPIGRGVVGTAAANGQTILATDVTQDQDWRPNPYLPDTRGELAVPIKLRDEVLGILDVQSDRAGALSTDDRLLLEGLCGQIAVAIESTRLVEVLRRSEGELSQALQIAKLAYWEYDVEKDLFLFNDQFYSIFHTTAEQAGGYQLSSAQYAGKFVYPDDLPVVGAEIERALNSTDRHYSRDLVHRIQYADGGVGYMSVSINIDRDEQGHILRYYGANQDITERQLAELAVRRSEAELTQALDDVLQFKSAFEHTNVGMAIVTTDGRFMSINQALCDLVGYTREELQSKRFGELTHPDDISSSLEYLRRALTGEIDAFRAEKRYLHKNGEVIWIELSTAILRDANQQPLYFISQIQDIRQRKRIEEVIRANEAQLSEALTIAKLAYWEYDVEKDLFLFNDQFYSIFHTTVEYEGGYQLSSAQYAGKFVYPDDLPVVGSEIERALNSTDRHYNRDLVHRIQYVDGGVGYMSVSINIDRDENGKILRYYGANQDITERQLAEGELEKFKLGLERSSSAIFITDPQGVITYVNPAFEKIYGYTPQEALGQTPRILKSGVIPQEQYKNFWDTLLHGQIVAGEIVNKAKDGRLIPIEGSNNPIQDENGQLVGFLGMHTDITQRKQAEQILRQSEAQLSQALQISKLAYWEYDVEKDLFQFNDQFYSIFHTTAEQAGGYHLSSAQYAGKFVYPDDLPVVGAEIERALNSTDRHYSRQIDHRIQYADGGVGYIAVSINIDRDEQGKILRYYGANQDISERKQVEEALAQEQYLTHALMESVADHIYFKDVQSRFLRISKSLADRFGLSDPAQAIGKTDFDFFTEEHARPAFEDEQQIIRTGQPITQEERETWLDQPDTWVLTTKLPLRDEFGNIVGTFGISHDTTERKQAEALLAQERNLLRILIDSLPLYVYIKDRTSKFVINNKLHLGVMGAATQEEVIGKGDFDFFPAEDAAQYFADEQALMQSDQPLLNREETVIDQTTGQRQWVSSTKVPYHDGRGNVIGLVGVTEDITERKRAEEEMQRTQRFLDSVVENIPLMLFVKDATDLRFVRWNKAGEDLMGIARVEMLGKNDLDLVPPEEAELFMANDQQVLINKEPLDIPEEPLETRFKGIRTLHTRKIPILDEQGNPQYLLGISEDITERKQAEAMLAQERNLLQTVIDTLPDSIYAKDTESRFTLANLTEIQLNGATTFEDLRGKNDFDRYPRELAEQYFAAEQPVLRDGVALINHEERGLDRMGNPRWHLSTKVPLLDSQGHIVGLVGMTRDITESKQAEVEREQLLLEQQQRALQLQTASEISRAASSILKLDELLPQAVELIRARFGFYYVGIFLADDTGRWAVLRAGTGEAGQTMLTNAHQLEIGGASMIGQCIANRQARVALDVGQEAIRSDNPLLPLTHSEMALPLTSRGSIIGAMTIQSDQAAAFTSDDVTVLQSMADQISNAVENARLYEQANTALQEVDAINRRLTGEAWDTYLHHQAGQEVISLTDDSQTAPEQLSQVDDLLAAGEITIEPTEDDPSEATVSAPILLRGQPIGALRMRTPLDSWDKDAEAILTGIAGHVAQAVENARLIEQTQRTASRERAINEINARVRQTIDLDAILRTAVNELGQSLKAARVTARIDVSDDTQTSRRRKTDTGPLPAAADRPRGNDHD